MNGPFLRNYSNHQPPRSSRSVPVQQPQQRSSPKVVSVPVHFVSSDQPRTTISMLKDSAALKIQKVFRGYAVRKSVKKIAGIGTEVSEIERRIEDIDVVDLIRRDAKERLKVNETLMSLLFKLDSIRGVDCGVRELRKAVTKKAIALQEKVDSIAQIDQQTLDSRNHDSGEIDVDSNVCTSTSDQVTKANDSVDETVDNNNCVNSEAIEEYDEDESVVKEVIEEAVKDSNAVEATNVSDELEAMEASSLVNSSEIGENDDVATYVQQQKEGDCANYAMETSLVVNSTEVGGKCDTATDMQKQKEGDCADYAMETSPVVNSTEVGGKCDTATDMQKQKEGDCADYAMETSPAVNSTEFGGKDNAATEVKKQKGGDCASYVKKNREILQSLVDDNEKMMRLMSQISERNEMQTRMINLLSRRVEQLEKALATEKQRKKKTQVSLRRRRDEDSFCI